VNPPNKMVLYTNLAVDAANAANYLHVNLDHIIIYYDILQVGVISFKSMKIGYLITCLNYLFNNLISFYTYI